MPVSGAEAASHAQREHPVCSPAALRLLDRCSNPMWIFGFARQSMAWANPEGLKFWDAQSVREMCDRDVRPVSAGVAQRLENLRHQLRDVDRIDDLWTLYPNGMPKSAVVSTSLVAFEDGSQGLLCEVLPQDRAIAPSAAVHDMERRAIEAINHAPLMISLMTLAGTWLMHNAAAEALMRRLGRHHIPNVDNFLAIYAEPQAAAALRAQALEKGSARAQLRLAGILPRFHDVTLGRIVDPATGQSALMLSQLDITRAKVLERRLERALRNERAMSETQRHFLSLTTHEFRTPLAIIDSSVRRLRGAAMQCSGVPSRLDTIAQAVARMLQAIDTTLMGGRVDEGQVPYNPAPVDLAAIAERAVAVQQELHPAQPIALHLPTLPVITGDAVLIEQAIDNLLSNAVKFSPAATPVEVTGALEPGAIAITVRDHGIGIPPDDLPRLSSRFFRARNAKGIKGTGIGLMAVHHFMDLHGGTVEFSSQEGHGTTATLRFPMP